MSDHTVASTDAIAPPSEPAAVLESDDADVLVESDLLVEDVSIDGMCGVY